MHSCRSDTRQQNTHQKQTCLVSAHIHNIFLLYQTQTAICRHLRQKITCVFRFSMWQRLSIIPAHTTIKEKKKERFSRQAGSSPVLFLCVDDDWKRSIEQRGHDVPYLASLPLFIFIQNGMDGNGVGNGS